MVMGFLQSDYHVSGVPPESAAAAEFGARANSIAESSYERYSISCVTRAVALRRPIADPDR
jgi:hypothetical protein